MKKILQLSLLTLILFSCKKEETTCAWSNTLLDGKTFAISSIKIKKDSTDITTTSFTNDPCLKNKITFSGSNYLTIKDANCTTNTSGTWLAKVIGNEKQLDMYNTTFTVTNNTCNEFTIEAYLQTHSNPNETLLFTYTKQ